MDARLLTITGMILSLGFIGGAVRACGTIARSSSRVGSTAARSLGSIPRSIPRVVPRLGPAALRGGAAAEGAALRSGVRVGAAGAIVDDGARAGVRAGEAAGEAGLGARAGARVGDGVTPSLRRGTRPASHVKSGLGKAGGHADDVVDLVDDDDER